MDTFQDLNDYNTNTNNVSRAARLTLLSTLPTNNLPASRTAAATLDSRDVVLDDAVSRAYGGDHDYLIETERNMGEVNDQFMRFTAAHNLNLAYSGSREGGLSSRDRGTGVETGAETGAVIGTGIGAVQDCVGSSDSSRQCSAVVAEPGSNSILSSTNRRNPWSSDIQAALADACHSDTLDGIAGGVETREAHAASYEPVSESSRASSIVVEESKEDRDVSSASSLNCLSGIVVDSDDYNSNFCRLPPLQPLGSLSTSN